MILSVQAIIEKTIGPFLEAPIPVRTLMDGPSGSKKKIAISKSAFAPVVPTQPLTDAPVCEIPVVHACASCTSAACFVFHAYPPSSFRPPFLLAGGPVYPRVAGKLSTEPILRAVPVRACVC